MLRRIHSALIARSGLVVLLSVLSAVPMTYWSVKLFGDLRADLSELLPGHAQSVLTLRELERRFGGWSELLVLVESPDPAANKKVSDEIAEGLIALGEFRSVRNKLGEEGRFFYDRRHLFIDLEDLESVKERLEDAATDAKIKANPLLVELEEKAPVVLDFSDIEVKYRSRTSLATRFPDDYFQNPEGTQVVILARKRGLAFGVESNKAAIAKTQEIIARAAPDGRYPGMTVSLSGDVKNIIEEHTSLVEDLTLATIVVTILLALLVLGYYRRVRALYLIALPLFIGTAWTFGAAHFVVGYLNSSSAFLGPIVPGNGINFGLILLARYIEERRHGRGVEESVETAVFYTGKATGLAAVAASIAYGSLMSTDFLGFKHFGVIGGIGMILCWFATFLVLPSLIVVAERRRTLDQSRKNGLLRPGRFAELPMRIVGRAPTAFAVGGLLAGLLTTYFTLQFLKDPMEKDFRKLRSTVSVASGSASVSKKVDAIFGAETTPQVVLAERPEDVEKIVAHLDRVATATDAPISEVTALSKLVPADQEAKLEIIRDIRKILSDELIDALEGEQRKLALAHRPPAELAPFGIEDVPESIRKDFTELDGREGLVVLVTPNMARNLYHADEIDRVSEVLKEIPVGEGRVARSSGNFVIYSDMISSVRRDGPKATLLSFGGVLILCLLAYRRLSRVLVVTSALLLGVAWLGAYLAYADVKINFLNFIALPITFGIGVDYAVNIYTRYRLEAEAHPVGEAVSRAVSATGGAVMLCSLTTIIGYGSLLLARNGALISFGKVAIVGELTCIVAAVFVMPAWIMVLGGKR